MEMALLYFSLNHITCHTERKHCVQRLSRHTFRCTWANAAAASSAADVTKRRPPPCLFVWRALFFFREKTPAVQSHFNWRWKRHYYIFNRNKSRRLYGNLAWKLYVVELEFKIEFWGTKSRRRERHVSSQIQITCKPPSYNCVKRFNPQSSTHYAFSLSLFYFSLSPLSLYLSLFISLSLSLCVIGLDVTGKGI